MPSVKKRRYWVVSPNVRNNKKTVSDWRRACVAGRVAFMGWGPDESHHKLGHKFAYEIQPHDIILIARRYRSEAEIVGFGVVQGVFKKRLKGIRVPDEGFSTLRNLRPFVPQSRAPAGLPLVGALAHTGALAELHPDRNKTHARVCEWLERKIAKKDKSLVVTNATDKKQPEIQSDHVRIVAPSSNYQLDYQVRTTRQVWKAQKIEAKLMNDYCRWVEEQGRTVKTVKYKNLQCDGFEEKRRNLIEAKASARREHIRMAIGQLLDYAYQGEKKFRKPNLAILLPDKPEKGIDKWLESLKISLIWREKRNFFDNANGQFT